MAEHGNDPPPGPFTPRPHRVVARRVETADVVTLSLQPLALQPMDAEPMAAERGEAALAGFRPGQFNMLTAFGVGEVPISIAGAPGEGSVEHAVRDVGAVTHALCALPVGGIVGVRGPFGTAWDVEGVGDRDVVVVAGGIGLAPLRGAVQHLVCAGRPGRVTVLVGARAPDQVVFRADLDSWRRRGAHVEVTVDVGARGWDGPVGLVTALLPTAPFDPAGAVALVCGPEVMMRFTVRALLDRGVAPGRIRISLERNMQCGCGLCGHCQLGPLIICRDGPVVPYDARLEALLTEREL